LKDIRSSGLSLIGVCLSPHFRISLMLKEAFFPVLATFAKAFSPSLFRQSNVRMNNKNCSILGIP